MGLRAGALESQNSQHPKPRAVLQPSRETPYSGVTMDLSSLRIIQKNLVYIINLPPSIARQQILTQPEYFSQYGTIQKCILSPMKNTSSSKLSFNCYITFSTQEQAALCIRACNFFKIEKNFLEVTLGTTRYCTYFINNQKCPRNDCLFLHKRCPESEIVFREGASKRNLITVNTGFYNRRYKIIRDNSTVLPRIRRLTDQEIEQEILECQEPISPCRASQSRFQFAREGSEGKLVRNDAVQEVMLNTSPSRSYAHITSCQYQEILSPLSAEKWASDVIHAVPLLQLFNATKYGEFNDVFLISPKCIQYKQNVCE